MELIFSIPNFPTKPESQDSGTRIRAERVISNDHELEFSPGKTNLKAPKKKRCRSELGGASLRESLRQELSPASPAPVTSPVSNFSSSKRSRPLSPMEMKVSTDPLVTHTEKRNESPDLPGKRRISCLGMTKPFSQSSTKVRRTGRPLERTSLLKMRAGLSKYQKLKPLHSVFSSQATREQ
jgi:hypothetical protein